MSVHAKRCEHRAKQKISETPNEHKQKVISNQLYTHTAKHCLRACARMQISITATSENPPRTNGDWHENQLVRMSAPSQGHEECMRSHRKNSPRACACTISKGDGTNGKYPMHESQMGRREAIRGRSAGGPRRSNGGQKLGQDFGPFCPLARPL